jgi:D-tagatose-1,6-bisphosphate aldolase subunit GatZ/KbaZ
MIDGNPLKDLVASNKGKAKRGLASICSSNEYVIEASLRRALPMEGMVLVEATANQVNQFGGYTGMRPADFMRFLREIAGRCGFPPERLMVGGDHLGPLVWRDRKSGEAMELAADLVREFVLAGFTKIHVDTSMPLGGDKEGGFDEGLVAERGAFLCEVCERAFAELRSTRPDATPPAYVIGSEVPTPGGIQAGDDEVSITEVGDLESTIGSFREAFMKRGLSSAWDRVVAVVAQLGVEFGDDRVHEYDRERARPLSAAIARQDGIALEGHSTDYQTKEALREMVEDGVAILKVGPALTFALREALFALAMMEKELCAYDASLQPSRFIEELDQAMIRNPENWKRHYRGSAERLAFDRKFSYSDRCRYYLPDPAVKKALDRLIRNLRSSRPPLSILSQFMPRQYGLIRSGRLENDPEALVKSRVIECLDDYGYAVNESRA